ncbi:hypothetical protein SAMN05216355_102174 [Actinomyces ruminicola]|uniref:Prokaryotic membrane lipoprotein lipid attachment site profile n=1 Tax=Actinomyces ruminicola TaxID=332524 RepID=A0A1H0AW10_9ACTO|nr:hypothetical protein [Actinomyces ruminicola]SDN37667.1 hypothetical protein SAMN05216355_102174 [Actinomyces ruminicola]
MKRTPRLATIATTTLTAVALTVSMSACSSGSDDAADQGSDQGVTADAGTDATAEDTDAGDAEASSAPTVPDGYSLTEVPDADLAIAIPSDWTTLTGDDVADAERVAAMATALNTTEDDARSRLEMLSLYSIDMNEDSSGYGETLNVQMLAEPNLPSEDQLTGMIEAQSTTEVTLDAGDYSTVTTGSGADAIMQVYDLVYADGSSIPSAYLVLPTADGSQTAYVAISTTSAERTQELADVILSSV